ncbi:MAG: biopolymer transporter ExbD, partial [Lentisphaeria bacterium]|nr:biopolymer transporter ExbD [Lentisphaeria bacterium]
MNLPRTEKLLSKRIRPRLKPIHGAPDLLPFINVFFLLLLFFMIGSSFVPVSGIPVNLPEAASVSTYSVKKYIVTLDRNGRIYFNDA